MRQLILYAIIWLMAGIALTGAQEADNIVPNPGFEGFSATPLGWYYTGDDFSRVVRYWESATAASPDAYGPRVFIPSEWKKQGFGSTKPFKGKAMVGITCFGCQGGKPHCREYVEIQLLEPLVPGQRYQVEFWVNHLPKSLLIQDLSVAFRTERVKSPLDKPLDITPQVTAAHIMKSENGKWQKVVEEFIADEAANYLLIGNFRTDAKTRYSSGEGAQSLNFAYYYLDEINVHKLPPILDVPESSTDLSQRKLETGQTVVLQNIYFDHDKDEFLPRSYKELNLLVQIMREFPSLKIMIKGHTDNIGSHDYNMSLSLSRAEAVANYLTKNGISVSRTSFRGYGSTQPVDINDTEEGRQRNRRVEFVVVAK